GADRGGISRCFPPACARRQRDPAHCRALDPRFGLGNRARRPDRRSTRCTPRSAAFSRSTASNRSRQHRHGPSSGGRRPGRHDHVVAQWSPGRSPTPVHVNSDGHRAVHRCHADRRRLHRVVPPLARSWAHRSTTSRWCRRTPRHMGDDPGRSSRIGSGRRRTTLRRPGSSGSCRRRRRSGVAMRRHRMHR
ncbi:MAG: Tungstate ABC transporter, permease protein, partial [uncultured Chloroflexia bacterium]